MIASEVKKEQGKKYFCMAVDFFIFYYWTSKTTPQRSWSTDFKISLSSVVASVLTNQFDSVEGPLIILFAN